MDHVQQAMLWIITVAKDHHCIYYMWACLILDAFVRMSDIAACYVHHVLWQCSMAYYTIEHVSTHRRSVDIRHCIHLLLTVVHTRADLSQPPSWLNGYGMLMIILII